MSKLDFLKIKNQSNNSAELFFYGDIVSDTWEGYWFDESKCPEDIRLFLDDLDPNKDLTIYINSGGGNVFAGITIYNMLKRHKGYKTVYVDGVAASIASVIALAGDRVVIPANAFMMIHKPWGGLVGNADELREMADVLDRIQESILSIYQENLREGVELSEIEEMINKETWLSGHEAMNYFNIEVKEENNVQACASDYFNRYNSVPQRVKEPIVQDDTEEIKNKLIWELELM